MIYMGSKNRIAKHILPIMLEQRGEMPWVEPFVGGGNMIDKVDGDRAGYDLNPDAINALILIRDSPELIPKDNTEFTEEDYKNRGQDHDPHVASFASFVYSFGSKHWGGWARNSKGDDYVRRGYNNAAKQSPKLKGAKFQCLSYDKIRFDQRSVIYCDPPYKGTTKYKGGFDHKEFWKWCQRKANEGHIVFVSEYSAPSGTRILWEKELFSTLRRNDPSQKTSEKLFLVERSA